jgi:glycosyltransferase involved in cell wall biosynthesis
MPTRILHIYTGNLYGGVETFLATLARRADLWGDLQHNFALCMEGRLSREIAAAGAPLDFLGWTRVSRPWTVLQARQKLSTLLRRDPGFDVAVCHSSWPQALFGSVIRACKMPLVFFLHGPVEGRHWTDRWAKRSVPDLMIGVSKDTAATGRLIYPNVRTEVLNYPIPWPDPDPIHQTDRASLRSELGAGPEKTVIIQVSRMEPWKGHDQHLRALALIKDLPNWVCWIAGGSQRPYEVEYRAGLERLASDMGLSERVRFLGERRDIPKLLAAADLFCQANRGAEGFSLAFMEAFTAGLPIVTMNLGGAPEMIDESCGVLIAPGDIPGLAAGLRRLILDSSSRARLGEAARRRVWKLCDPAAQIGRLGDLLEGVVRPVASQRN